MSTHIMQRNKISRPRHIDPAIHTQAGTGQKRLCQAPQVKQHHDEAGYMLLAVIFLVALVVLSLALAAPKVAAAIQRDREVEMVHRGEQYKRAIRLYYKKFGSYPSSIDQLEKTNNVRYLRKRYLDPLTGKDDWKLIRQGHAHVCPLGFFGQPLGIGVGVPGATAIGAGSSPSIGGSAGLNGFGGGSSAFGGSSGIGSGIGSGSAFGSNAGTGTSGSTSTGMMDSSTSQIGSGGTNCGGAAGAAGTSIAGSGGGTASGDGSGTGTGPGSSAGSSSGAGGSLGSSSGSFGSGASSTTTSTTLGGGNTSSTGFGADISSTLGGAPIMGVMPPQTKATILQYKLKTHYNEWEFTYWPVEEQMAAGSILGGAGNINGAGNSVNGPGSSGTGGIGSTGINSGGNGGFGSNSGGTGFGGGTSSGSTGNQSTTSPQ